MERKYVIFHYVILMLVCGTLVSPVSAASSQPDEAVKVQSLASEQNIACEDGKNLSPINVTSTVKRILDPLRFDYQSTRLDMFNTKQGLKMRYPPGSYMYVGERAYQLEQIYFVSPSDHAVNGKHADMEMQLVHRGQNKKTVIISVLFEQGGVKQTLDVIWRNLPEEANEQHQVNSRRINASDYIPEDSNYYFYVGSHNRAKCEEGVSWFVMQKFNAFTTAQLKKFHRIFGLRPHKTHDLHRRTVRLSSSDGVLKSEQKLFSRTVVNNHELESSQGSSQH